MTDYAYAQIKQMLKHNKGWEWNLLGFVRRDLDPLKIIEFVCLPQKNSRGSTEIESEAMADFLLDLHEKGYDGKFGHYVMRDMVVWVHSHCNMSVFWSSTDEANILHYGGADSKEGFLISIVVNDKCESLCRVDTFDPIHLTFDELPWTVLYEVPAMGDGKEEKKFRETMTTVLNDLMGMPDVDKATDKLSTLLEESKERLKELSEWGASAQEHVKQEGAYASSSTYHSGGRGNGHNRSRGNPCLPSTGCGGYGGDHGDWDLSALQGHQGHGRDLGPVEGKDDLDVVDMMKCSTHLAALSKLADEKYCPGTMVTDEFKALVKAGMPPDDAATEVEAMMSYAWAQMG